MRPNSTYVAPFEEGIAAREPSKYPALLAITTARPDATDALDKLKSPSLSVSAVVAPAVTLTPWSGAPDSSTMRPAIVVVIFWSADFCGSIDVRHAETIRSSERAIE